MTIFDLLFGCWHRNYSFPITATGTKRLSPAASMTGTYVVCLDCGKEFAYSWEEMKVVSASHPTALARERKHQTALAAAERNIA